MKYVLTLLAALACTGSVYAQRAEPLVNYENLPIVTMTGKELTSPEFKTAVSKAGQSLRWEAVDAGDNKLALTQVIRGRHTAVVTVQINPNHTFSVTYRDSVNLNYAKSEEIQRDPSSPFTTKILPSDQYEIHPTYNRMVRNLVNNIRNELRRL